MTCSTCHPLHARGLKRGRSKWFGLILDSGAQNVFKGRRGLEMVIKGRRGMGMVIGGRRWVFKAQMGFLRRRGVGMVIEGRRSFSKGAEGWGW